MSAAKPRLGRGLSALLGDVDPSVARASASVTPIRPPSGEGARIVPIAQIHRNPDQPRKRFDETELDELASSIRTKGVLQPILVRPLPGQEDTFQIVAGERRWRASQRAGLHEVPILVRDLSDEEVLEISIIENVQRQDLNAIEEARGYKALIDQFGHTQEDIAKAIGKSRSHVANTMRLLALPPRVQDMLYEQKLSAGHARAIVTAPNPEDLADKIVQLGLTVREAEALARDAQPDSGSDGAPRGGRSNGKDADTLQLEKDVAAALGLDIDIRHRGDLGGEVKVKYATLDQLQDVCRRLRRAG